MEETKSQLETDFLKLEKTYKHSPEALQALTRAAAVSARYVDFIVTALKEGCNDPADQYRYITNIRAHYNKHKNDAQHIYLLQRKVAAIEAKLAA